MKLAAWVLAALALWPFMTLAEGEVEVSQRNMTAAYSALASTLDGAAKARLRRQAATAWSRRRRTQPGLRACDIRVARRVIWKS